MRIAIAAACVGMACHGGGEPARRSGPEVRVDRRVEVMSILQRLVGEREYVTAPHTAYVADVDRAFAPFANHPAVAATRELRRKGIVYDAPIQLAVQLDDHLALHTLLTDPRFAGIDVDGYLASLRDFAAASHFDDFFAQHRAAYDKMTAPLRLAIEKENPAPWFDAFFGKRASAHFVTIAAPLLGTWNYGPHVGDEIYEVMGIAKVDFDERPVVDAEVLSLVVHELAHSYINPLFAAHRAELEPAGERLFAAVRDQMTQQAYGQWDIMLNELAVRTVTTLYWHDRRGADAAAQMATGEVSRGFRWLPQLVVLLQTKYETDRTHYATLDAFVPELAHFLATAN